MHFGAIDHFLTGVAIPVFSLRSEESCGTGEFYDLIKLAQWCKHCGIELIQLLPINDTGWDTSPYSALSSVALHPLYIRLQAIPEAAPWLNEIKNFHIEQEHKGPLKYQKVLRFKLDILHKIYQTYQQDILSETDLHDWLSQHPWIIPYAVYRSLKDAHLQRAWFEWPTLQNPTAETVQEYFHTHQDRCFFYVWLQYHLDQQLTHVSHTLAAEGIRLKGDIPIMMSEDSVDVWFHRKYFDRSMRAGAPPDRFTYEGQNWNFPVYRWDVLAQHQYDWWKQRLRAADRYYHAYRIDHVLGFFRLWQIPITEVTAILGHFHPAENFSTNELTEAFSPEWVHRFTTPHISEDTLHSDLFEPIREEITPYLLPAESPTLFHLRPEIASEKTILSLPLSPEAKNVLLSIHRDRTLVRTTDKLWQQAWFYQESSAFQALPPVKQEHFQQLVAQKEERSELIWEHRGRTLLSMMQQTTPMLVCAEDLGAVPKAVPIVLEELRILSLKIERWMRMSEDPDAPFIHPREYPRLSVCTPSVHDLPPIRLWWEESPEDRRAYCKHALKLQECPEKLTPEIARMIIQRNLEANSILTIFQIQDLFTLDTEGKLLLPDPADERINIPGKQLARNWRYRIPVTLEELLRMDAFNQEVTALIAARRQQPVTPDLTP